MKQSNFSSTKQTATQWVDCDGKIIACEEKIKILNENMDEIHSICQDALEDALLMGCSEADIKKHMITLIESLHTAFTDKR